jgi:G3E family GTPase
VTLRELHADRGAGKVAAFRRVILETSGAADPAAILQTLVGNRALAGTFHLAGIVTVVDSMHGSVTLAESPEARMQVALADRFVVTKVDLTSMEQVEAVEAELAAVNPCASLLRAIDGNADPGFVLAEATPRSAFAAAIAPLHMPGMTSFSLAFERSFTPGALREAMSTLTQLRGRDLLRVKGLVNVAGCRGPVVVHAVRHQVHPPSELERWPDEDRRSRFVFVVRDTPADAVRRLFDSIAELASVPDRSSP